MLRRLRAEFLSGVCLVEERHAQIDAWLAFVKRKNPWKG